MIIISVALFLVGSILSGFAHNMVMLIVYRGLQGLGAGGVMPLASTIVGDLYTGHARVRIQGYLSSVWAFQPSAAAVRRVLIDHAGWPTIFWLNVPFGILCIGVFVRFFDERVEPHPHRIDYAGSILLALGTGTLMFVLVTLGSLATGLTVGLSVVAAVLIVVLIAHELHTPEPMLPLRLYRLRIITVANSGNFAMGALAMGITAFLPTFVQGAMGLSTVLAGATLGVMSAMWTVGSLIVGRLLRHTTYRVGAVIGSVLLVFGSIFLVELVPTAPSGGRSPAPRLSALVSAS